MAIIYASDTASAVWLRIRAHFEERLATLRLQNDAPMDELKRAMHIGRINECKYIIDLDKEHRPSSHVDFTVSASRS